MSSIYFTDDFIPIWKKLQIIAKREGKTASELIRDMITTYVDIHDPGNPQARITSYVDGFQNAGELASIEGKIREQYLDNHRKRFPIKLLEITSTCREHVPVKQALAMSNRIYKWLRDQGVVILQR